MEPNMPVTIEGTVSEDVSDRGFYSYAVLGDTGFCDLSDLLNEIVGRSVRITVNLLPELSQDAEQGG